MEALEGQHPVAKQLLEHARRWGDALRRSDPGLRALAIGSVFRGDFDPTRSDFDIVFILDGKDGGTAGKAITTVTTLSKTVDAFRAQLAAVPSLAEVPVSPSAYFDVEIASGVHRTGDPDYYSITRALPLWGDPTPRPLAAWAGSARRTVLHPGLLAGMGFVQQVRHIYLLPPAKRGLPTKPWEKLFHHLRAVLRVAGEIAWTDPVQDRKTVLTLLSRRFPDSEFPLGEIYASLAPGYDLSGIGFDILLAAFESLQQLAWRANVEFSSRWAYAETPYFASREILSMAAPHDLFAVDMGVAVYLSPGLRILSPEKIVVSADRSRPVPSQLVNPSEDELLSWPSDAQDETIARHLRARAVGGAQGVFRTKVGVSSVAVPVPQIGQPLTLEVYPLSYWTIENFNRYLLLTPDPALADRRKAHLEQIIAPDGSQMREFGFPAALFLEVALVTADDRLVVLRKQSSLSALASRGFYHTCSLEEGLEWPRHVSNKSPDLQAALSQCMSQELGLGSDAVVTTELFGVALEATHLNLAILGVTRLSIDAASLQPYVAASHDFSGTALFLPIERAVGTLFSSYGSKQDWHPLGRMRALLAAYSILGREKVLSMLAPS